VVNSGRMIVRLAQANDKDAVFTVSETALAARTTQGSPPGISVQLLSNPLVSADGVVREIAPTADPATRTYQVKVSLLNPPSQMRFGGSVSGRLKASTGPVVVVPSSSLFDKDGLPAVWLVDSTGSVRRQVVSVHRYETGRVVVTSGLSRGDVVVTAGVNRLREHQKVHAIEGGA
jgi:RND family efflux transporter MFP subunit